MRPVFGLAFVAIILLQLCMADVYLHHPHGSNNRLNCNGNHADQQQGGKQTIFFVTGVRAHSDLGGSGDLLARKNYTMLECVTVDIEILTHLNCKKNKSS